MNIEVKDIKFKKETIGSFNVTINPSISGKSLEKVYVNFTARYVGLTLQGEIVMDIEEYYDNVKILPDYIAKKVSNSIIGKDNEKILQVIESIFSNKGIKNWR